MLGLVATLIFACGYYQCSVLAGRLSEGGNILLAATTGICGYFLGAWVLHFLLGHQRYGDRSTTRRTEGFAPAAVF
jgi:hypothetical protein